ncbi:SDR family oxidoreductase [Primorskyibacter flagellatus]|uniref:2-deoxy-D-gluconate 3-dehydrogenase n=1 Tax=Primorskyibacter flagellatus TaxID=1387277 RepID=A0A1W2EJ14_9RHOB|nr:SDR family oxidoreductase [Primorskyibacter flagellatus]SMD09472.1 2-deoxy-D-gluconate 3-dehydrogenase [Primorskyibacter flagellatus]
MTGIARMFDLTGKRALVTGARTGLGRLAAETLAEAGADIIGLGSEPMPETAEAVVVLGRHFEQHQVDLTDPAAVRAFCDTVDEVDILINNAGQIRRQDLLEFSQEDWDAVVQINLTAAFSLSQAVARRMVNASIAGRIVNIASLLSFQGGIRVVSYTSAKHGILGLTRAMANELAGSGITVNAIAPGYIATDNTEALRNDPDRASAILERIPAGRWGRPEDLAPAMLFLCAPASGYVTGSCVTVDGGWMTR